MDPDFISCKANLVFFCMILQIINVHQHPDFLLWLARSEYSTIFLIPIAYISATHRTIQLLHKLQQFNSMFYRRVHLSAVVSTHKFFFSRKTPLLSFGGHSQILEMKVAAWQKNRRLFSFILPLLAWNFLITTEKFNLQLLSYLLHPLFTGQATVAC